MALIINIRVAALALAAGIVAAPAAFADTAPPALLLAQSDEPAQSEPAQSKPAPSEQAPSEQAPSEQAAPSEQPQAVQPNDEQIDSFVVATVRIINIQREAQQEITAAQEAEQQQQVRDEALQQIVQAVEEEGLSVDEYNGIVAHVESNPELGETVKQRIQEQIAE